MKILIQFIVKNDSKILTLMTYQVFFHYKNYALVREYSVFLESPW